MVENFLPGQDCCSTIACLRKLGVAVEIKTTGPSRATVRICGRGPAALTEPGDILDAGNSGTTIRLLLGVLAGQPFCSVITGDTSLRQRPMTRICRPLQQMGAFLIGRRESGLAPLAIKGGNLKPLVFDSQVASAQVKSAVLLAGLFAKGVTSVSEPYPSRDHTERMLRYFGAAVRSSGNRVGVEGPALLEGRKVVVPGDISSAAFLIAAAAIVPGSDLTLAGVGVNPTRSGIIDVLLRMGADIELLEQRLESAEPVADIRVRYAGKLSGVTISGKDIPRLIDEIPVLAVVASLAEGDTVIKDAAELKVKESNRITTVASMLELFGAVAEPLPDGLLIHGGSRLKAAVCDSYGDHRLALAATVAGLVAEGSTVVRGAECMDVSFPGFASVVKQLAR